ncbi:MAG: phosphatidate cytidylyltransferase, partial [Gammaproteobacteria bacterium]|nr:phosphatidate cytidylyltransferase [Gammaproteobacteria bacterium]
MLRQRVLTAIVLVALALWAILGWSGEAFALGFAGVAALAAWEWSALAGVGATPARLAYVAFVAALLLAMAFTPAGAGPAVLWAAVPWWV